jgi:hypothetical protein
MFLKGYKNMSKTRPLGSARKYIRPPALFATILVGMFAVVRAIDATPKPTPVPTPTGIGCIYLADSYVSEPPIDPNTIPGITNPHMKGVLWRETWERLDRNGQGQHDWAFLDACMNASDSHGKDGAFQVLAGNFAPPWFFTLPGAKRINAGSGLTTVPFDPVFQSVWQEVQTAMANRYRGRLRLRYVVMSGVGHGSESFFANTPEERTQAEQVAHELGYPDAITAWEAGVRWLIDMYERVWGVKPIVLCTGAPFDADTGGTQALQDMMDYGDNTYRGRFGARADDLTARRPNIGQPSADIIIQISPHCIATGYQFGIHQNVNDRNPPDALNQALVRGTGFGAHFIEVFADDADNPISGQVLDDANARMGVP